MTFQSTPAASSTPPIGGTGAGHHHHHHGVSASSALTAATGASGTAATPSTPSVGVTIPSFASTLLSAIGITGKAQPGGNGATTLFL